MLKLLIHLLKDHDLTELLFDDFLVRDGKVYKKFSDVPYTGEIKTKNGKDKFWMKTNYKDGLKHGLYQRFFLDGSLMETGMYKKGNRTGQWKGYYPDGSVDYTITNCYE